MTRAAIPILISHSKPRFIPAGRSKPRILAALNRVLKPALTKLAAREHMASLVAMVMVMSVIMAGLMAVILLIMKALLTGPQAAG